MSDPVLKASDASLDVRAAGTHQVSGAQPLPLPPLRWCAKSIGQLRAWPPPVPPRAGGTSVCTALLLPGTPRRRTQSTGQLSLATSAINLVGCIVRIFTSVTERAGTAMVRSYCISESPLRGPIRTHPCGCGGAWGIVGEHGAWLWWGCVAPRASASSIAWAGAGVQLLHQWVWLVAGGLHCVGRSGGGLRDSLLHGAELSFTTPSVPRSYLPSAV